MVESLSRTPQIIEAAAVNTFGRALLALDVGDEEDVVTRCRPFHLHTFSNHHHLGGLCVLCRALPLDRHPPTPSAAAGDSANQLVPLFRSHSRIVLEAEQEEALSGGLGSRS